jgi:copper chaperone CopZ
MCRYFSLVIALSVTAGCAREDGKAPTADVIKTTPVAFNTTGAPTVEFSVPDMMCPEGCGVKVKEILAEQPGAKEVLVDFDTKTAKVAVEEGKFDSQKAIAALVDHSFGQSTVKSDAATKPQAEAAPVVH